MLQTLEEWLKEYRIIRTTDEKLSRSPYYGVDTQKKVIIIYNAKEQDIERMVKRAYDQYR